MAGHFDTVDDYIAAQPGEVQEILRELRRRAFAAVPGAGEMISYGIPTITRDGHYVMYFAAWKRHISVYPVPSGDAEFEQDIAPYRAAKGTLKFPLGKPIPYELIEKVAALLAAGAGAGRVLTIGLCRGTVQPCAAMSLSMPSGPPPISSTATG